MNSKKKTLIISTIIILLLLLAVGGAYAFFSYENGTKSDIVTGQIYMNYEETSTISLTGVFPETKAQALARQDENGVFEFTITGRNTSKYPIYYEIDLLDGGVVTGKTEQSTKILPEHVMIYLEKDGVPVIEGQTYKDFNNQRIYVETVPANQETNIEHKYVLRMWIDENVTISDTDPNADYTTTEWNDSYASLKVRVVGDFEEKKLSVPINELVKSRLGNDGVVAISTTGDLYEGTGEIREYRYSGSARYCTYTYTNAETNSETLYRLNVEGDICPNACIRKNNNDIYNLNSEHFIDYGTTCGSRSSDVELVPNQETPLDGEVKNYVWFNNESWRIIGVFKTKTSSGEVEELVKLIKDTPIASDDYPSSQYTYNGISYSLKLDRSGKTFKYGYYIWSDGKKFGQIKTNDWTKSGVQYYLNDDSVGSNSYYNSLDNKYRGLIETVEYYLGNVNEDLTLSEVYAHEHLENCPDNSCVWEGNEEIWLGKIGLMYPSDYGYAANNTNWAIPFLDYYNSTVRQYNWMNDNIRDREWMISPSYWDEDGVMYVYIDSTITYEYADSVYNPGALSPVLYLKSSVMSSSGDGSYSTPYVIE